MPGYIPSNYHAVTPYLIVDDAAAALEFYHRVLNAKEQVRMPGPNGKIAHAEILVGDSHVMLADEAPQIGAYGPKHFNGSPVTLMVYVPDVDATYRTALAAGAVSEREPADQFYGDRTAGVKDPFGHKWYFATHVRDVTPEEMKAAMAKSAS
ncbi:MAG TPA: VOC family protein [Vicinamibacterales bacterium]|nr:VOC family protein [Vicinamibacterales bacterium]